MSIHTRLSETASQKEFLKHANFSPVFDEAGNIIDIRELEISTDRRAGIEAMRELFATSEPGDDVLGADGWTGKQRRILKTPAPLSAHYLKSSEKYDAKTGMMKDALLIQLPFEVVWTMFEDLFEGQYSVIHKETRYEDEEVVAVGKGHNGQNADDAPGRRFFAVATVTLRLSLPGQLAAREYDGVGVAYGQLTTDRTGNIYKINSERRTVEKGAIADAKREALANIGRVFRRAFEDGDDMVKHMHALLLGKLQEQNKPAIHKRDRAAVPPPVRVRPATVEPVQQKGPAQTQEPQKAPVQVQERAQAAVTSTPAPKATDVAGDGKETAPKDRPEPSEVSEQRVEILIPNAPARLVHPGDFATAMLDVLFETCSSLEEAKALRRANEASIATIGVDMSDFDTAMAELAPDDEVPDFAVPAEGPNEDQAPAKQVDEAPEQSLPEIDLVVDAEGKSGKAVLDAFITLIAELNSLDHLDALVGKNVVAMRKMTVKQSKRFWEALTARKDALKG